MKFIILIYKNKLLYRIYNKDLDHFLNILIILIFIKK